MVTAPLQRRQDSIQCPECNTDLLGQYCHECGGKVPNPHDFTIKHFLHQAIHEFTHLDSKVFRTLRALVASPGTLTAEYLAGKKQRYVLPLRLFILVFALNFFLYTRPGVALYDIRFIITASPQGQDLEKKLERGAQKRHTTKEVIFDQINEHWQHNASLFQLGDVFFFAVTLAIVNRRRYFGEHLIFSLHTLSFSLLYGSVAWLYYLRYGFRQNWALVLLSFAILLFYLWRAIPRVYGARGWHTLLKAF